MRHGKNKRSFEDFGSDDIQRYQNHRLIRLLEAILDEKGELTARDLQNAYEQLIEQDLEFLFKSCFLRQSGDHSVNTPKCCLAQLSDAGAVKRDAVQLANYMKTYVELSLYHQPKNKRLQIYNYLKSVCLWRSLVPITSGDRSTFAGVFQLLGREMNGFDEEMYGETLKWKPALESFLIELGPRIVSKINKYYDDSSLGFDECQICTSCCEEESDIKSLSFLPCFKTAENLESFLAERFRQSFYAELADYLLDIDDNFWDDAKMNLDD